MPYRSPQQQWVPKKADGADAAPDEDAAAPDATQAEAHELSLEQQIEQKVYNRVLLLQARKHSGSDEPRSLYTKRKSSADMKELDQCSDGPRSRAATGVSEGEGADEAENEAGRSRVVSDLRTESLPSKVQEAKVKVQEAKEREKIERRVLREQQRQLEKKLREEAAAVAAEEAKVKVSLSQELSSTDVQAAGWDPNMSPVINPWDHMMYVYPNGMGLPPAHMSPHGGPAVDPSGLLAMHHPHVPPQSCTTVMLRNIPNKYTRDMLVQQLDEHYEHLYDFLYLPIDFTSSCNVGYAFINFRTPTACQAFVKEFNGVRCKHILPGFNSTKVCQVTYARVQGRDANMENLCDQTFVEKLADRKDWQPLFWDDEGKLMPFTAIQGSGKRKSRGSGASPHNGPSQSPMMAAMSSPMMGAMGYGPGMVSPLLGPAGYPSGSPMNGPYAVPSGVLAGFPMLPPSMGPATPDNKRGRNTLMLRNIPNKYTRAMLLETLNSRNFKGLFDFLYLPIDFSNRCNMGYAFINFRNEAAAQRFTEAFHNIEAKVCLPGFNSQKVCSVSVARVQSLEANLDHFRRNVTQHLNEHPDWQPLLFDVNGDPLPFPGNSTGQMNAEAPAFVPTFGSLPEMPSSATAIDSRALEFKMHMQAECDEENKPDEESAPPAADEKQPTNL